MSLSDDRCLGIRDGHLCGDLVDPGPRPSDTAFRLRRRGVDHGWVATRRDLVGSVDPMEPWSEGEPCLLPRALGLAPHRAAIGESVATFDRLRNGARFLEEVEQRLWDDERMRYAGSTVDRGDDREIERLFVDVMDGRQRILRDLWARLSWIADDESDASLRIRFSFGHEQTGDWIADPSGMPFSNDFCQRVFPECAAIDDDETLQGAVRRLAGEDSILAERIIYANHPGGGAVFHHDGDPGQRGVVFSQLDGATVWLALSRRRLAQHLADHLGIAAAQAQRNLAADEPSAETYEILNRDPDFTARLAADGCLFVVRAGDVLLLPSTDPERTAWHSVFAVGKNASLAHSYGVYAEPEPDEG